MNYANRRKCTLVCGVSGSGKTTFVLRYLVNAQDLAVRFVWDPDGQMSDRLGLPAAATEEELKLSVESGWVLYDPNLMFPGKHAEAFQWFCGWAFHQSSVLPGTKVLVVDEVWRYCSNLAIPSTLAECIQTGRVRGLDCLFATQRPNRVNESITNEVSELVAFRIQGTNALKALQNLGLDPQVVWSLPPGQWISWNLETGSRLEGRLW